jgi:triacylglycerol lipase
MLPFDGPFAESYVYPFAFAAYDSEQPPDGYVAGTTAFEILCDYSAELQARLNALSPRHRKPLESMLAHPRRPHITSPELANSAEIAKIPRSDAPNRHFGWICIDQKNERIVIAFRGSVFFHDWLDDFDFAPAPYSPLPGRGTVHQGFLLVYETVRASVRSTLTKLLQGPAASYKKILITGHSLGGALSSLSAPDLVSDLAAKLEPAVYTWSEPRVGHHDYVQFFDAHVNLCYRIVNLWDVVPHLPPILALYEHEGSSLHINSGFSLDMVHNHVLITGYAPGIAQWNHDHPSKVTEDHLGLVPAPPLVGKTP